MDEYLELIIKESYAIMQDLKSVEDNLYESYSHRRLMDATFRLNTLKSLPEYKQLYDKLCKEYSRISYLHEQTIING